MAEVLEFEFRNRRFRDAGRGLRLFYRDFNDRFQRRAPPVLRRELERSMLSVVVSLRRAHGKPWPTGTTDTTLSARSGKAMARISRSVRVSGRTWNSIQASIAAPGYMRIHEYGGTLRPSGSKYLAIPTKFALTSRGVPLKRGPKNWTATFVKMSKKGRLMIFQRRARNLIVPLYTLATSVTIRPRLGMGARLRREIPRFVDRAMMAVMKEMRRL